MNFKLHKTVINIPGKPYEHGPYLSSVTLLRCYPPLTTQKKQTKFITRSPMKKNIMI